MRFRLYVENCRVRWRRVVRCIMNNAKVEPHAVPVIPLGWLNDSQSRKNCRLAEQDRAYHFARICVSTFVQVWSKSKWTVNLDVQNKRISLCSIGVPKSIRPLNCRNFYKVLIMFSMIKIQVKNYCQLLTLQIPKI